MITNLLIFFAIPLAIVLISISLEKILRNPFLVTGLIFSFLLIIVLALFDPIYLIAVLAYTILAFITIMIYKIVCRCLQNYCNLNSGNSEVVSVNNKKIFDNSEMYDSDIENLYENNKCRTRKYY